MFEKYKRRQALKKIIPALESSAIVREAVNIVEAGYVKGFGPGAQEKEREAISVITARLRALGHTVYDEDVREILIHKIRGIHALESMARGTSFNDYIDSGSKVF